MMRLWRWLCAHPPRWPWQNPWGAKGRPAEPGIHDLANRLTGISLRRDWVNERDLETWEGRARWDAYVRERERNAS